MIANTIPVTGTKPTNLLTLLTQDRTIRKNQILVPDGPFGVHVLKQEVFVFDHLLDEIGSILLEESESDDGICGLEPAFSFGKNKCTVCWYQRKNIPSVRQHLISADGDICSVSPKIGNVISLAAVQKGVREFCTKRKYVHVDHDAIVVKYVRSDSRPIIKLGLREHMNNS